MNSTDVNNSTVNGNQTLTSSTPSTVPQDPILPHKGAAEEEHHSSMAIFFVLTVIGL